MSDPTTTFIPASASDAFAHLDDEYRRMTAERDAYRLRTRALVAAGAEIAKHLEGCVDVVRDAGAITLAWQIEEAVRALHAFKIIETEGVK